MGSEWLTILWQFWCDAFHIDLSLIAKDFFGITAFILMLVGIAAVVWFFNSIRGKHE